jgi:hypothetical protein
MDQQIKGQNLEDFKQAFNDARRNLVRVVIAFDEVLGDPDIDGDHIWSLLSPDRITFYPSAFNLQALEDINEHIRLALEKAQQLAKAADEMRQEEAAKR